ncbi:MAG: hypothetical protein WD845_17610 [Pirellulales bacterium]
MRFCRRVFFLAGLYGFAVLLPLYFAEGLVGRLVPPEVTHPEFYYGFVGGALAWQVVYLLVALEPLRLQPLIVLSALAKLGLVVAVALLVEEGRTSLLFAVPVMGDLVFGLLFLYAYALVRRAAA